MALASLPRFISIYYPIGRFCQIEPPRIITSLVPGAKLENLKNRAKKPREISLSSNLSSVDALWPRQGGREQPKSTVNRPFSNFTGTFPSAVNLSLLSLVFSCIHYTVTREGTGFALALTQSEVTQSSEIVWEQ